MVGSSGTRNDHTDGRKPEVWLALETSTQVGSVAVHMNGLALETTFKIQGTHSERLLPAIDRALQMTGAAPAEVGALIVGSGPGSFTGVRIAAALAKGWAAAREVSLYAYSSLLGVAAGSGVRGPVCAMFDARRGEVYAACYELEPEAASVALEPKAWRLDDLLDELNSAGVEPVFSGEAACRYRSAIRCRFSEARVLPEHLGVPRAASLLWLKEVVPELGRIHDVGSWGPLYVREWSVPATKGKR